MAASRTISQTVAEMREFAGLVPGERRFIEQSLALGLELGLGRGGSFRPGSTTGSGAGARDGGVLAQRDAYRELRALASGAGAGLAGDRPFASIERVFAVLVRVSAQDLMNGGIETFTAYRFLYERLLGARARPFLAAAFCAAAALPQIAPARRRQLLRSLREDMVTAAEWSLRPPAFHPCALGEDAV